METSEQIISKICITSQHKEMLYQVLDIFQIRPDYDLQVMKKSQNITQITTKIIEGLQQVLKDQSYDMVLVHGDTTTCLAAAIAAFYAQIPVGHVEAGLRSYHKYSPYPEEMNRRLTSHIADYHFAPTKENVKNLRKEGIHDHIYITGNTGLDSFQYTVRKDYQFKNQVIAGIAASGKKIVILTAHRRENIGEPLIHICRAVKKIIRTHSNIVVIYPVHLNPAVRKIVYKELEHTERVYLIDPLDVEDMHNLLAISYLVMTDSGGLQEEAPYFHVPVVVLRKETERMEAQKEKTIVLAGIEEKEIITITNQVLTDSRIYGQMALAKNPYGDGHASERIVAELLRFHSDH